MKVPSDWNGQPYYPISQFYKKRFGERVHKISVSVAETCPNRQNNSGEGCVFCDQWGSAGNRDLADLPLIDQIRQGRERLSSRFGVGKFLVYFQAFTNTYARLSRLEKDLQVALNEENVCGTVLGTRPDCLPADIYAMLKNFSEEKYISVELGAQSFYDNKLAFLKRGHTAAQSIEAIHQLSEKTKVDIGIHLIFGLPDESVEEICSTAEKINQLPVGNVKLHNLHVLAGTELERLYKLGGIKPISLENYSEKVIRFLERLSPDIAVQRLAAYAGQQHGLIAPEWTGNRMMPSQFIINHMKGLDTFQGKCYEK